MIINVFLQIYLLCIEELEGIVSHITALYIFLGSVCFYYYILPPTILKASIMWYGIEGLFSLELVNEKILIHVATSQK